MHGDTASFQQVLGRGWREKNPGRMAELIANKMMGSDNDRETPHRPDAASNAPALEFSFDHQLLLWEIPLTLCLLKSPPMQMMVTIMGVARLLQHNPQTVILRRLRMRRYDK
jgi:hypothetical protein